MTEDSPVSHSGVFLGADNLYIVYCVLYRSLSTTICAFALELLTIGDGSIATLCNSKTKQQIGFEYLCSNERSMLDIICVY